MLKSVDGVDALFPIEPQEFSEESHSPLSVPGNFISHVACWRLGKWTGQYSLAKAVVQVARSRSEFYAFSARQHSPTGHIFVVRRAAEIKDDLELVAIAFASQYRFAPKHFAKHASENR